VTNETTVPAATPTWQRELAIAAAALAFGLLALPFVIYTVGQRLIGEYAENSGALALAESIWVDLAALRLPAWVLVLSPYLTVQLVRWVRRVWWPKRL
jgi:hypothetical protein